MKRMAFVCLALILCWTTLGCTKSAPTTTTTATSKSDGLKPEQVIERVLQSMKNGNKDGVASLLTNTARIETAKAGLEIQPPAIPNAGYKVLEAVLPPEDPGVAHVSSIWSEGEDHFEIIWVLRQEQVGWRVAGLAMTIDENQDPLFCNFENPAEMLKVTEEAVQAASAAAGESPADGNELPAPSLNPLAPVGEKPTAQVIAPPENTVNNGLAPVTKTAPSTDPQPLNQLEPLQSLQPLNRPETNQARQPLSPAPGFDNPIRKR